MFCGILDIWMAEYYGFPMTLPNKITIFRIALTPIFFVIFFIPEWFGVGMKVATILLWITGGAMEISDVMDGYLARKMNQVTDLGKVLDPFGDVISRVTFFLCFAYVGIMPIWLFVLIMYREMTMTFLRMVMMKRGVVVAASNWGKLKAIFYTLAGAVGMFCVTLERFNIQDNGISRTVSLVLFSLAVVFSLVSFAIYMAGMLKATKKTG